MDAKTSHAARYEIGLQGLNAWFISITVFTYVALISILSGSLSQLYAQVNEDPDKTLSPYFFVQSDDPTLDQLPLKSTTAEINIAGVIADVHVTQTYKNEGKKTLEAIYVFPASTRAAVYGMQMTIGEYNKAITILMAIFKNLEGNEFDLLIIFFSFMESNSSEKS